MTEYITPTPKYYDEDVPDQDVEMETKSEIGLTLLHPKDIRPVDLKRTENVPVNQNILDALMKGKTIEISVQDVIDLRILPTKMSANVQVPELLQFDAKELTPKTYQVSAHFIKSPPLTDPIFSNETALTFLKDNDIKLYKFTGELPKIYNFGFTANLYEFPQGLLKIRTTMKTREILYDSFGNLFEVAKILVLANKCTYTNRVVGLVYFPNAVTQFGRRWGILLEKVPNAMSLSAFLKKQPESERKTIKERLWESVEKIGNCLYDHDIHLDFVGLNNIIVDGKTGQVWFVDLEYIDAKNKDAKSVFLKKLREYFEKLLKY